MKKFTTTMVLGLFLVINAKANHYNPQLNLKLYDNAPFTISLDNVNYANPSCKFSTSNISPGNHYITVTKHIINPYGYYGNTCITVFKGYVNLPVNQQLYAQIDHCNTFTVYNQVPLYNNYGDYNSYNNCNERKHNKYDRDDHGRYNNNNDCRKPQNECRGMNMGTFNRLKMMMNNTPFSSSKLKLAKQAIAANGISAEQVEELMKQLDFETDRLNLAKFAYLHTVDKNNSFIVNNAFDFDSSIAQLDRYIAMI